MVNHIRKMNCTNVMYLLMQDGEWEEVANVIVSPAGLRGILDMSSATNERGLNILHAVCRFQPPEELIEYLIQNHPFLAHEVDCWGRYPLHYATRHGSRSAVVKALLAENPLAAMHSDKEGKLPVHYACRPREWVDDMELDGGSSSSQEEAHDKDEVDIYEIQPGSAVIVALCDVAPESTNVEDKDGCNALELAIEYDLSEKICEALMRASDKAWKEAKKKKDILEAERHRSRHIIEAEQRRILRDLPSTSEEMIKQLWQQQRPARRRISHETLARRERASAKLKLSRTGTVHQRPFVKSSSFPRTNTSIKGVDEFMPEAVTAFNPIDDSYRTTMRSLAA